MGKMLNLFDVPALLFFLASGVWAAEVPRFAHELTNFSEELTVPAGALDRPQIFNIVIAKIGEVFPKIDIFPYIHLTKAAKLEVRAVRNTRSARALVVPVMPAEHSSDALTLGAPTTQPSVKLTFYRTAAIEASVVEKSCHERRSCSVIVEKTRHPIMHNRGHA